MVLGRAASFVVGIAWMGSPFLVFTLVQRHLPGDMWGLAAAPAIALAAAGIVALAVFRKRVAVGWALAGSALALSPVALAIFVAMSLRL